MDSFAPHTFGHCILDTIDVRMRSVTGRPLYTFLGRDGAVADEVDYATVIRRASAVAARLELAGVRAGDRVLLVFPPDGLEFVFAFIGCMLVRAIAVPVAVPNPRNLAADLPKFQYIARDSGARFAVTTKLYRALTLAVSAKQRIATPIGRHAVIDWPDVSWIIVDSSETSDRAEALRRLEQARSKTKADTVVFLQYTSGSTSNPKGATICHGNLIHNLSLIARNTGVGHSSVLVGWVPLYHDMGLTGGILTAMYTGARCVYFAPSTFLERPRLWLEAIDRYRGTHTAAPDFGYSYVLRAVQASDAEKLDLSSLRVALQGGEPMRPRTMERFSAACAPLGFSARSFCNVFGMAESVLFVSAQSSRPPTVLAVDTHELERSGRVVVASDSLGTTTFVGCGKPDAALDVVIVAVDPETRLPCPERVLGELWVSSPSVSPGYWTASQERNDAVFRASIAVHPDDTESRDAGGLAARSFLRTGDVGFVHDGEVFLCGRSCDIILVADRSVHPQEIEQTVLAAHPSVRPGNAAGFGVAHGDGMSIVIVAELRTASGEPAKQSAMYTEIAAAIHDAIAAQHGLACREVVLLAPNELPKTSSGKLRRSECRRRWQQAEFQPLFRFSRGRGALAVIDVDAGEQRTNHHVNSIAAHIMELSGRLVGLASGLTDEAMSPELQRRLDEAPPLSVVDLGSGVLGVKPDPETKQRFRTRRLPIVLGSLLRGVAAAAFHTARDPYKLFHDNDDLTRLLDVSSFGRRIRHTADGPIIDLAHHEGLDTLPGFYCHGITARLCQTNGRHEVIGIDIAGHSITRGHPNWALAKIHLLVGIDNETLFADHAVSHVNNNYVEAAARRTLSPHNPLWLFLRPHFDMAIPLNEWIFELFFKHASLGNPFGLPVSSILKLASKGFRDDHANGLAPSFADTRYNRALDHAQQVARAHVDSFVARNLDIDSPDFVQIRAFADIVHERIPYCPAGNDLTLESLAQVVTRVLHETAFVSAADHVVLRNDIGYFRSVLRLRRPFSPDERWQPRDLFQPMDTFQRIVFRNVFSGDRCTARLADVTYDPTLRIDLAEFRRALAALEQRYPRMFPRERIAATIDI